MAKKAFDYAPVPESVLLLGERRMVVPHRTASGAAHQPKCPLAQRHNNPHKRLLRPRALLRVAEIDTSQPRDSPRPAVYRAALVHGLLGRVRGARVRQIVSVRGCLRSLLGRGVLRRRWKLGCVLHALAVVEAIPSVPPRAVGHRGVGGRFGRRGRGQRVAGGDPARAIHGLRRKQTMVGSRFRPFIPRGALHRPHLSRGRGTA